MHEILTKTREFLKGYFFAHFVRDNPRYDPYDISSHKNRSFNLHKPFPDYILITLRGLKLENFLVFEF